MSLNIQLVRGLLSRWNLLVSHRLKLCSRTDKAVYFSNKTLPYIRRRTDYIHTDSSVVKRPCNQHHRSLLNKSHLQPGNQGWRQHHIRSFHTSKRRQIPPVLWVVVNSIAKLTAALTGRSVRKWFQGLSVTDKKNFLAALRRRWYIPTGIGATLVGSGSVYYITHLEETPITGRRRFVAFTHEQILKISEEEAQGLITEFGGQLYTGKDIQAQRVLDVVNRLMAANEELQKMQFRHWQIYVVKDPLVNACVLPSGHLFVFDGILELANTQDQLAIILGHEMAHAVLEHGIEELSRGRFVDICVIFCLAALWCVIPSDGIAAVTHWFYNKVIRLLTHMPHSRKVEIEADRVGLMFAAKACFDVREGTVLWKKMAYQEKFSNGGKDVLPEWMSTHPDSLKRADFLNLLQPQAAVWRNIGQCPRLPDKDPRETFKILSQVADSKLAARKTGQDLRRVQRYPTSESVKAS